MKRSLLAVLILLATSAGAQRIDQTAALKRYASKVLPKCPGSTVGLEAMNGGPSGFMTYSVTLKSDDPSCGAQRHLVFSPKSQQILIGTIVPLPPDDRPAHIRISEQSSKLLKKDHKAIVAPFPLPDGVKSVAITRETAWGAFSYQAFLDASEKFMIVGYRGLLSRDPALSLRESIGAGSAARRGNTAGVEVIEISDFQCPSCANAHHKIEPLIQKNLSKINYIRIDLPLFENHEWSIPAALGARAIQRVAPAKYWQYVDYVFKNQESIGRRPFDQLLREYCADNDIDWSAVQKFYASKAERQALLDQVSRIFATGVASTPTFMVNGQIVAFGPDGAVAIDAIKAAVAAKK
ncbi:MAG TPA: thioredoxin domain-containing protein [Thermoanaerobaculia bacterium]